MRSEDPNFGRDPAARAFDSLAEMPSVSPVDGRIMGWFPVTRPDRLPVLVQELAAEVGGSEPRPLAERRQLVHELREALAKAAEPLARTISRETGKPLVEVYGAEIVSTLRQLDWLERNAGRVLATEVLQWFPRRRVVESAPHGVIGVISPWNYPLYLSLPTVAAALIAGNAVLWKPSELALETAHAITALIGETSAGPLVQMAAGGPAVGEALLESGCDKYVFVGSSATGRQVLETLGAQLKPAVAELSGVDPMVVCDDADLDLAVRSAVWGRVCGAGQTCMAPRRIFVQRAIYDAFLDRARRHLQSLRIGDPLDPQTEVGPLRTSQALTDAAAIVEDALLHGARLLCGGHTLSGSGFYFEPTLLADCNPLMNVFRRDVFAPIVAVAPFSSDEEAVTQANDSPGMLTASIWTRDPRRGRQLANQISAGVVSINEVILTSAEPDVPFGGSGQSGNGRMRGAAGLREMVQTKVIDEGPPGFWPRRHLFPYRAGTLQILQAATRWTTSGGVGRLRAAREFGAAVASYQRRGRCG